MQENLIKKASEKEKKKLIIIGKVININFK